MDILLTSTVSLLAAIIGGWIAGKYALRAQKQAAEDQRQTDTGKDAKLGELEQKLRAQIEEIQKMMSDVQKMILKYPA